LEYTYQFYLFRVIMMRTVSENQSRFSRFPLSPLQRLLLVNTGERKNTGAGAQAGGNGSAGNAFFPKRAFKAQL